MYTRRNAQKTHFHRSTCLLSKVISAYFVGIYFLVPIMPIHCLYWHFSKKCYIFIVKSGFLGKITKNFDKITKIATALSGKIVDLGLPPNIISLYKYAPLMSCDVERSFSTYKSILVDKRILIVV